MPYALYKSNGTLLTTIDDGTLNLTTDLKLVGRNYAGYGQIVNENLIKLLENFANKSAPTKPLTGQLWYDTAQKKLKIYDGQTFNNVLLSKYGNETPSNLAEGDFWFDSGNGQLYVKYNGRLILIGPSSGGNSGTGIAGLISQVLATNDNVYNVIKLTVNGSVVAVISSSEFTPDAGDSLSDEFNIVKKGITLKNSDAITGVSSSTQFYFWGSAADSERLNGRSAGDYLLTSDVSLVAANITELGNITRISSGSPATPGTIEGAWTLIAGSSLQATYADIAERYHADSVYPPGTVLTVGGVNEVTVTEQRASRAVAGVVSSNPAFKLNSEAGDDQTHPYLALKGKVPCNVVGPVRKGQHLVTSTRKGYAEAAKDTDTDISLLGIALEDCLDNFGQIMIKI